MESGTTGTTWRSTNGSAVINNARGNCSDGDTIFVKSGVYNFGSGEYIDDGGKNDIQLIAEYGTVLNCTAQTKPINLSSCSGWKISGFEIDGNNFSTSDASQGIYFDNVSDSLIEECHVYDFRYSTTNAWGIYLYNCDRTDVVRCKVERCEHGGIMLHSCRECDVVECVGLNNAYGASKATTFNIYGTSGLWCEHCHIIDCYSFNSGHYGGEIYQYCNSCSIQGGSYIDSYTAGLRLGNVPDTCFGCGAYGVTISTTNRTVTPRRGIDAGSHITIQGCTIKDTNAGIYLDYTDSNFTVVTGNTIRGCPSHGIWVKGSWNTITGNSVYEYGDTDGNDIAIAIEGGKNNSKKHEKKG